MGASGDFMSSVMQAAASPNPAQPPQAQQTPQPQQPAPNPVQQAQQVQQQIPASHDQAQGSSSDPRPVGYKAQDETEATPQQQAQYAQLVLRFENFISDTKVNNQHTGSTAGSVMKQLNNPKLTVPQAIGAATANVIYILWHAAKAQKVDYDPTVMFHAADECNALMYLKGQAAGIFKGTPPFNVAWMKRNMHGHEPYPFTPVEVRIIVSAKLFAVRAFGELEQKMGDISPQVRAQALAFWKEQVQKEISEGKVSDATVQKLMQGSQYASQLASAHQALQSPAPPQPAPQAPPAGPQQQPQPPPQ